MSLGAVDNLHNTAGDIVLSMNNEACYNIIRDAGIRSGKLCSIIPLHSYVLSVACRTSPQPAYFTLATDHQRAHHGTPGNRHHLGRLSCCLSVL